MPKVRDYRSGVYCWKCKVDGKVYVGSGENVRKRKDSYPKALNAGKCHNRHFQFAWNKYGESAFHSFVLEWCTPEACVKRETFWIVRLHAADPKYGYNICPVAFSRRGAKVTEESRKRIVAAVKLSYEKDPTLRHRVAKATKEAMADPEIRAKISEASRNRSPEVTARMAATKKENCGTTEFREGARQRAKKMWTKNREAMLKNWETRRRKQAERRDAAIVTLPPIPVVRTTGRIITRK